MFRFRSVGISTCIAISIFSAGSARAEVEPGAGAKSAESRCSRALESGELDLEATEFAPYVPGEPIDGLILEVPSQEHLLVVDSRQDIVVKQLLDYAADYFSDVPKMKRNSPDFFSALKAIGDFVQDQFKVSSSFFRAFRRARIRMHREMATSGDPVFLGEFLLNGVGSTFHESVLLHAVLQRLGIESDLVFGTRVNRAGFWRPGLGVIDTAWVETTLCLGRSVVLDSYLRNYYAGPHPHEVLSTGRFTASQYVPSEEGGGVKAARILRWEQENPRAKKTE